MSPTDEGHDVRVNDKPKFMDLTPTDNHHVIVINRSDQEQQQVNIPLSIRGVILGGFTEIGYVPESRVIFK